jgi:hypothetical protein
MDLNVELSVLEQHAEQLRAEAMELMHGMGEEGTGLLSDQIQEGCKSDDPLERLVCMLADIGFCEVFARAGRTIE